MATATLIAKQIEEAAEATRQRTISIEDCSFLTKALWDVARELGLEAEVDRLVQEASEKEFTEACKASGIAL